MKTPTAAWKKAQAVRDQKHVGETLIVADDLTSVVYTGFTPETQKFTATIYKGRGLKPRCSKCFNTEEERTKYIDNAMKFYSKREASKIKVEYKRACDVGDVFAYSYGYESTKVIFYMVTKLIGKASVELVEIGRTITHLENYQLKCEPNRDEIKGKPFKKRVQGNMIPMDYYNAFKYNDDVVAESN